MIEIQGHRGARGVLPENTLPAFNYAVEIGADGIELDLLLTKDGEVIIHHDVSIYSDLVLNLTLPEIKRIDVGSTSDPHFPRQKSVPGIQIPTLQELFNFLNKSAHPHAKVIHLNLEIKQNSKTPELFAQKIIDLVYKNGFQKRVAYSSFDHEVLYYVRKIEPKAKIGFINEKSLSETLKIGKELHTNILSPKHILLENQSQVEALHKEGFRVIPWTVNEPSRFLELAAMKVDGVITDYPLDLMKLRNKKR